MTDFVRYCIDPLQPFPKRWRDKIGPVKVMTEPAAGYIMCRRPGAFPFALSVAQILNADRCISHGPFELVEKAKRKSRKQEGTAP